MAHDSLRALSNYSEGGTKVVLKLSSLPVAKCQNNIAGLAKQSRESKAQNKYCETDKPTVCI